METILPSKFIAYDGLAPHDYTQPLKFLVAREKAGELFFVNRESTTAVTQLSPVMFQSIQESVNAKIVIKSRTKFEGTFRVGDIGQHAAHNISFHKVPENIRYEHFYAKDFDVGDEIEVSGIENPINHGYPNESYSIIQKLRWIGNKAYGIGDFRDSFQGITNRIYCVVVGNEKI